MPATSTTYVTTPSTDELEKAWWDLMQGELGLDHDHEAREFFQTMLDHLRKAAAQGYPILDAEGEPVPALSSKRTAERLVRAYADLFYGA